MRPGHIKVFDGLRITTEHMDHLQNSLHSALREIRQVLGLGRVYEGFEVTADGDDFIIVQPGSACDYQNNRIACDEPTRLRVHFAPEDDTKYVLIKYERVENTPVEEIFTRVWDSGSVYIGNSEATPDENSIAIARLERNEGTGGFHVVSLLSPSPENGGNEGLNETVSVDEEEGEAKEGEAGVESGGDKEEVEIAGGGAAAGSMEGKEFAPRAKADEENRDEINANTGSEETEGAGPVVPESLGDAGVGGEEGTAEAGAAYSKPARLQIKQGVARLTFGGSLGTYISKMLETRPGSTPSYADEGDVLINLGEEEVSLDFPLYSLGCRSIISFELSHTTAAMAPVPTESTTTAKEATQPEIAPAEAGATASPPVENSATANNAPLLDTGPLEAESDEIEEAVASDTVFRLQSSSQGEATFRAQDARVSQFCVSTIQPQPAMESTAALPWSSEITDMGVALLPLGGLSILLSGKIPVNITKTLNCLQLIAVVERTESEGFKVACKLVWKGPRENMAAEDIEGWIRDFTVHASIGWKAMGQI